MRDCGCAGVRAEEADYPEVQPVTHYVVTWEIDIDAETPQDAARQAWAAMRAPESTANVFDVLDEAGGCTRVDLEEL